MALKLWTSGEVLTSADLNNLSKQAISVVTSGTRPASPSEGMTIYETDTNTYLFWDAATWRRTGFDTGSVGVGDADDSTVISGISSTTPIPGTPVVGFSFTAPPSGRVYITVGGRIESTSGGNETRLGFEIRSGSSVGAGAVVLAVDYRRALCCGTAVNASQPSVLTGSFRYKTNSGALTPANAYNVRTMHFVTGAANGTVGQRYLTVEAVL